MAYEQEVQSFFSGKKQTTTATPQYQSAVSSFFSAPVSAKKVTTTKPAKPKTVKTTKPKAPAPKTDLLGKAKGFVSSALEKIQKIKLPSGNTITFTAQKRELKTETKPKPLKAKPKGKPKPLKALDLTSPREAGASAQLTKKGQEYYTPKAIEDRRQKTREEIQQKVRDVRPGYKEPGIFGSVVESIAEGTVSMFAQSGATIEMVGNIIGSFPLSKAGAKINKEAQKVLASNPEWREAPDAPWSPKKVSRLVAGALPSLLGVIGATLATGPAGGFAVGFGLEGGATYEEAAGRDVPERKAQVYGVVVGTVNGVLERIFPSRLFDKKKIAGEVTKKVSKSLAKDLIAKAGKFGVKFAKNGALEGSTEAIQELWSNVIATNYDKNRKLWNNLLEAFVGGFGAGGLAGAVLEHGEYTPQEVMNKVINTPLEKTKEGKILLKTAIEAKQKEENIVISPPEPKPPRKYKSAEEFVKSGGGEYGRNLLLKNIEETRLPTRDIRNQISELLRLYKVEGSVFALRKADKIAGHYVLNVPQKLKDRVIFLENKVKELSQLPYSKTKSQLTDFYNQAVKQPIGVKVKTIDDVENLIKTKAKEYGSKNEFLASDEYKKLYPQIQEIYKSGKRTLRKKVDIVSKEGGFAIKTGESSFVATGRGGFGGVGVGTAIFKTADEATAFAKKLNYAVKQPSVPEKKPVKKPVVKKPIKEEVDQLIGYSDEKGRIFKGLSKETEKTTAPWKWAYEYQGKIYSGHETSKIKAIQAIREKFTIPTEAEIEASQEEILAEVQRELEDIEIDSLDSDDPTTVIKEIAEKLANHFKAPGGKWKLTGTKRTYETPDGLKLEVGGTATDVFDRMIFTTDIEGFAKNIKVLAYKFDKTFNEIDNRIAHGDIDGADYDEFKKHFQKEIEQRGIRQRFSKVTKSKPKIKGKPTSKKAPKHISRRAGVKVEPVLKVQEAPQKPVKPDQVDLTDIIGEGKISSAERERLFEKIRRKGIKLDKEPLKETPLGKEIEKIILKEQMGEGLFEEPQALYARKWQVKMSQEPETAKKINKTQIMSWTEKAFGVPLKMKATHKWKAAGMYYPKAQIVRMEKWGELSVLAHEVSHHVDRILRKTLGRNWYRPNKIITKELADLDYDQKKRRTEEGFAEYIRHRMTTGLETEVAPEFHKYFNNFLETQPKLKSNLAKMKERFDIWHKQGAENRIIQHIDWKGEHTKITGVEPKLKKALTFINSKFNDEFYVPQKITKEIEKVIGRKLPPRKNPAIMLEYYKSKAGAIARTFVMDKAIDEYGNVVGPSLVEVLKPIPNKEMRQFVAYGVSKRAINLSKRGIESGFDIDDAKFIVEKYKDKGWDKPAQDLTNWSNHLLDWAIRAGGLEPKTAKLMRELNPIYLTFKRAFLDEIGVIKGTGGYVDRGGTFKAIKGSGRPIINPIEAMIAQTREVVAKAQKIKIATLFAELASEEGVGGFITRVPAPMKATRFSANQIRNYINEITGDIHGIGELDDFLTVFTQDFQYRGKENIVSIFKNGNREFYEIHPELYDAFKGIDPLKLGPVGKVFAPFARLLRLGATGLKASFGLARNPFRDALTYVVFSKRNKVTVFDSIKGIYKNITTKEGEVIWRFKKLGGALSGQIGFDRAATQNTYDELLLEKLGKKGKALKIIKNPLNALRDILSVTEMGPRSVEIEAAYKKYTSSKWKEKHPDWTEEDAFVQAFIDAQDITVNFTKSGKWAKQINEIAAFFNVAIRGPEKTYRSFRERPIATTIKGIMWLSLIAIGSWYKNKDKDWYKNLPPAYKYNNLFFEVNKNVYRLPIPFELGMIFMSAPQVVLDTYKDKDIKWVKGLIDLAKAQVPSPVPSIFQGALDVATNKNYLGIPIESEGMQYLYPTERKRDYTSKFAILTSKGLDKVGVHLSPVQLDYLLDSYSGGFLRQFRVSGSELYDLPVLGDLMLRSPDFPKRQLNEYFADYEVLKQKKQSKIATKQELRKLDKIDDFYKFYKDNKEKTVKAEKRKNNNLVKRYNIQLRKELARYGYR